MMARQHLEFAGITSIAATTYLATIGPDILIDNPMLFIGTSLIGSLIPDIDSPSSTIGMLFPHLSVWINNKFEHRTITHDLLLWSIVAIISSILFPITLGFWCGYIGHLILDAFTVAGICWGYSFHKHYFKAWRYNMKNMRFRDGVIHLSPRSLRVRSHTFAAKVLTLTLALGIAYIFYYIDGGMSIKEILLLLD